MEGVHPALQYFAYSVGATVIGLFFWLTSENLRGFKYRHVLTVAGSIAFTPVGAYAISLIIRLGVVVKADAKIDSPDF